MVMSKLIKILINFLRKWFNTPIIWKRIKIVEVIKIKEKVVEHIKIVKQKPPFADGLHWTELEINFLLKHKDKKSKYIAHALARTEQAVRHKRSRLNKEVKKKKENGNNDNFQWG